MSGTAWLEVLIEVARDAACPGCGLEDAVPLVWGLPGWEAGGAAAQRGEITLGGCLIDEGPLPDLQCRSCGRRWNGRATPAGTTGSPG